MSTNAAVGGGMSLADIMQQLAQMNDNVGDLSVLGDAAPPSFGLLAEAPGDASIALEAVETNPLVEPVLSQTATVEEGPVDFVKEIQEFTIVDDGPDIIDKEYNPESVDNDGDDEEVDIADEEEDVDEEDNVVEETANNKAEDVAEENAAEDLEIANDIELDMGSSDEDEDDEEQQLAAGAVQGDDVEDETFLRQALEEDIVAQAAEQQAATLQPVVEQELAVSVPASTQASFIDLEPSSLASQTENDIEPYFPEVSEVSQVELDLPLSAPQWQPALDLSATDFSSTAPEPSFEQLSVLAAAPAVLLLPGAVQEIPTDVQSAVESTVESVIEPAVEPDVILEQTLTPVVLPSAPIEVVQAAIIEAEPEAQPLIAVQSEEVQEKVEELKAEIVEDQKEIVAAAPEVAEGIRDDIAEKVDEIAEQQEEIETLQAELSAAQEAGKPPSVVQEVVQEIQEAKEEIQTKTTEIVQLQNLVEEQAAIVKSAAQAPAALPSLRTSEVFVPKTRSEILASSVPASDRADKAQLIKFSIAEAVNGGVNRAANIARLYNSQLGANLIYVPTVENASQMAQLFSSIDALNSPQLDRLLGLNLMAEQQQVYRDLRSVNGRQVAGLRAKKSQLDRFEEKVRRYQTLVYQPNSSVLNVTNRPRVQTPQRTNLDPRRPQVTTARLPGWVRK